jgi:competence protein ComEC
VHLEDLINKLQPKMVIADGSNYPSFVRRWKKTCAARGIPFHETAQQGAYPLN